MEEMKHFSTDFPGGSYPIVIGRGALNSLNQDNSYINADQRVFVVSETVYQLHEDRLTPFLGDGHLLIMKDGESEKNYISAGTFLEKLAGLGLTRKSLLIAVGGGVTGDFVGFLASVYMRGIAFIQVPTTLLSMVDSSVGGKVAVNIGIGKNMVGSFHQPRAVYSDLHFLETLPPKEINCGLAEITKHAIIGDNNTLSILNSISRDDVDSGKYYSDLVYDSCNFKSSVVKEDETEKGRRAVLNFGHTTGHAMESVYSYRGITHGEGVTLGMLTAIEISCATGMLSDNDAAYIREMILGLRLVEGEFSFTEDDIIEHIQYDKKGTGTEVPFVLLEGIGRPVFGCRVDDDVVRKALQAVGRYSPLRIL